MVSISAYAQSTLEEVIVTAQRTEQSLQSVPIAVSAFTNEILEDRQIEVSSDLQLQVPGITFSSATFSGVGDFQFVVLLTLLLQLVLMLVLKFI